MAKGIDNAGEVAAQSVRTGIPDQPLTAGATRRVRPARWAWPVALAVAAVVLFLCYFRLSGTTPDNSDGSDQVLQAWDMLHGNWLLHGWTVGDVSYYTTELPEYMIVAKILGFGPGVIHVAAAITYTLLVLLAGLLAKGRATGREGVVRALIASGILLAPQLGHGAHLLLLQPDHLGTQVPLLVIFIVLDRAPRRWYTPAAIAVMLTRHSPLITSEPGRIGDRFDGSGHVPLLAGRPAQTWLSLPSTLGIYRDRPVRRRAVDDATCLPRALLMSLGGQGICQCGR